MSIRLVFICSRCARIEEFKIRTDNAGSVRIPARMVPQAYQEEVSSQIEEMLRRKVIRLSSSFWLSPPVMVKKKMVHSDSALTIGD